MLYAIVSVLILIADQGLKYWVTLNIPLNEGHLNLIPGVLELMNIHNYGAAFGILQNAPRWVFIVIAVAFAAIVIVALRRNWVHGKFGRWTAVLVLAGALGNCIDRMLSGYVVDMFSFPFWPSFAIFNLADVFITVGGILFCLHVLFYRGDRSSGKQPQEKPAPAPAKAPRRAAAKPVKKRSAAPSGVAPVDAEDDLFAAWNRTEASASARRAQHAAQEPPAPKTAPEPPAPKAVPEPQAPKAAPVQAPPEAPAPTDFLSHLNTGAEEDETLHFSLDDILQEFSDY